MKLFNFTFTNEENIIVLLLLLIIIIMIVGIINKPTKSENQEQNNDMWVPYEQFEPIEATEQQPLELVFPGKSFEAPIIEEPHVINQLEEQQKQVNQLEEQQKQVNELKNQVPISSLNNEQILTMSQEPSYNFLPLLQKIFNTNSTDSQVQQPVVPVVQEQVVLKPVVQEQVVLKPVVQEQVVQQQVVQQPLVSQEEINYAGFNEYNNEIDYTNVEQSQIPVEQKVTNFNYNKSIEQVNPNDLIDNYSLF